MDGMEIPQKNKLEWCFLSFSYYFGDVFFFLGAEILMQTCFFLKNRHNGWNHQIHDQFDKQVLTEMKPLKRKEVKEWDDLPLGQAE